MSSGDPLQVRQPGFSLVHFVSSLPSFFLSGLFFVTWIAPTSIEATMVSNPLRTASGGFRSPGRNT